jgi:hypothetical protein
MNKTAKHNAENRLNNAIKNILQKHSRDDPSAFYQQPPGVSTHPLRFAPFILA